MILIELLHDGIHIEHILCSHAHHHQVTLPRLGSYTLTHTSHFLLTSGMARTRHLRNTHALADFQLEVSVIQRLTAHGCTSKVSVFSFIVYSDTRPSGFPTLSLF